MTSFLTLQMLNLITKNAFSPDLSVPKVWTVSSGILQNQNSKSPLSYKADFDCESLETKKDVLPSILAQRIAIPERRAGHRKEDSDWIKNMTWKGRCSVLWIHTWAWACDTAMWDPKGLGALGRLWTTQPLSSSSHRFPTVPSNWELTRDSSID